MKTKLNVWRNPDPLARLEKVLTRYQQLLYEFNRKREELEAITQEMSECNVRLQQEKKDIREHIRTF